MDARQPGAASRGSALADRGTPTASGGEAGGPAGTLGLDPAALLHDRLLASAEIEQALGQSIACALDLGRWDERAGLEALLTRVQDAITTTAREEGRLVPLIRRHVLDRLAEFPDAPPQAGVYRVDERFLRDARRQALLSGDVTATQGAWVGHESLAATIVSIGVSLVRYDGLLSSWRTTFLRNDYDAHTGEAVEELRALLDRRGGSGSSGPAAEKRERISSLLRRAFVSAAERKALLQRTTSRWRMGRGLPAPLELLTGSGSMDLIDEMLPVLEELFLHHQRWVFLPSTLANLALATLANALPAGHLAILRKGRATLEAMVACGTYDPAYRCRVQAFAARAGEAFVVGGFRATRFAPAQLFVAHAEHALAAGTIAMADAALQPHRGYPLLLDLARLSAQAGVGAEVFPGVVETAYARAGARGLFVPGCTSGSDVLS